MVCCSLGVKLAQQGMAPFGSRGKLGLTRWECMVSWMKRQLPCRQQSMHSLGMSAELVMSAWCACGVCTLQVVAWRCRGKVPLAVDVTAALVEACLHDEALQQGAAMGPHGAQHAAGASHNALQLMYALPIIRCAHH